MVKRTKNLLMALFYGILFFFVMSAPGQSLDSGVNTAAHRSSSFFDRLTAVSGEKKVQATVSRLADSYPGILNAFLKDIVETAAAFEQQDVLNPDLTPADHFVNRWSYLGEQCESCDFLDPVFGTIIDEFAAYVSAEPNNGDPLGGLFRFFQAMSQRDLNGFEQLFQLVWPQERTRRLRVYERKTVRATGREEDVFIHERRVVQTDNDTVTFREFILNNRLESLAVIFQDISVLHTVLSDMQDQGADPDAIGLVQSYVDLIANELEEAWNNGALDPFYRDFLTDPDFQARHLVMFRHPLLKPPYHPAEFQIFSYY